MATLPTPEQNGRLVLAVFEHFKSRPGHVLQPRNFISIFANNRWEMDDLKQGLAYAEEQGWIEDAQNGIRLTEAGFAAM